MICHTLSTLFAIALALAMVSDPCRAQAERFPDPLPTPTDAQIKAAKPVAAVKTSLRNSDGVWAFRGIIGPLGVMAQRSKQKVETPLHQRRREYRILSAEKGSPAYGRLLPGDVIIGLNGRLFKPGKYVNKHVERFKAYREPNWEMGRAIHEAYRKGKGIIALTVLRGKRKGTVTLNLGNKLPFSPTYPWNCARSQQLCKEIAENYLKEMHGKRKLDPWRAAWYGLFLLNYAPKEHRSVIDDIVKEVLRSLDTYKLADEVRGEGGGWQNRNNIWKMSYEATFLAEYAIMTNQGPGLRRAMDRYVELLFASRMIGNLWGHLNTVNYGSMYGGFMGASCQASLALQCLQKAGANVTRVEMQKVLDSMSGSIGKRDGRIGYQCAGDSRAVVPFDWQAIEKNTSQVASESIMRQGAVHLAMHLAGRMTEAEATCHFLRRQTAVFATHGMTQDAGVFDGARALASCSPEDCRALLDSYLPRLCMSLRWDGGVQLIPSGRDPRGKDEYSAYRERGIDLYIPAVMGLLLSMPARRLYLFSKVMEPGSPPLAWRARRPRKSLNECSIRSLTYADGSAYFVSPDISTPTRWAVYRHRFSGSSSRGMKKAIIGNLDAAPYELWAWKDKLIVSGMGRKGAVMSWDMKRGGTPRVLNSYNHSRASSFTEYKGSLYYISPQEQVGRGKRYVAGELWRTRDGLSAERVNIIAGDQPLWGLLHGCASWQTIAPNARSLQMVELGIGPRLFCKTQECTGGSANWTRPVQGTQTMWLTDGSPGKAQPFYRKPKRPRQWPGGHGVMAVDNNNSRVGSLIGFGYDKRLFFSSFDTFASGSGQLYVSNREGTAPELFKLGDRAFGAPNNFATFTHAGRRTLVFSFTDTPFDKQTPNMKRMLAITDGKKLIATLQGIGGEEFNDIRFLTSVGDSVYFVGITGTHGAELWHTDGTQAGTRLVRDFEPGPGSSLVDNLVGLNGKIYFTAWHESYGCELWRHDPGTGQLMVADIVGGKEGSRPQQVRAYGKWLVFCMDTTVDGSAVLRYSDDAANKYVVFREVGVL